MSDSKPEQHQLQQTVETLAVQLVMGGGGEEGGADGGTAAGVASALRQVCEQARLAGENEVGEIANQMLERISGGGDDGLPEALVRDMERLQAALEEPAAAAGAAQVSAEAFSLAQDPELLADFILESREHLANIEDRILELEQNPENHDSLHSAFRGFHTIKGLAGFLDLAQIQAVAHEVETVLDLARNEQLHITPSVIDIVLEGADYLKAGVASVEAGLDGKHQAPPPDHEDLIRRVTAIVSGANPDAATTVEPPEEETACEETVETAEHPEDAGQPKTTLAAKTPEPVAEVTPAEPRQATPARGKTRQAGDNHAVKVNTGKLDHLVDMVGELVVAQSLLTHDPDFASVQSSRLQRNLSQLARITTDVQRTAMAMRMVPVKSLFQRMTRLVRDLSKKEGKQIELVTAGEDTELDRNIVEELADPVMHMIRNSVGHGLETPDEREAAGKPPTGKVMLSAYHQSGFIMIDLADDGRGLSRDKIRRKAIERGLVSENAELSDHEIHNLIFEPGFSTASQVNDVSGRGVGMDVVKRNLTKLRGRVEIHSVEGKGTTFSLKLPLTLAIIEGLVVGVGKERYIVPIYTIREMLRPKADAITTLHNREEMVMVRGTLLPVVRLYEKFGIEPNSEDPTESLLLVAETLGKRFCLLVDDLIGKQEVVIKSLGETMKNVTGVSGGAILGDGHVGLILDMDGIFGARDHA